MRDVLHIETTTNTTCTDCGRSKVYQPGWWRVVKRHDCGCIDEMKRILPTDQMPFRVLSTDDE